MEVEELACEDGLEVEEPVCEGGLEPDVPGGETGLVLDEPACEAGFEPVAFVFELKPPFCFAEDAGGLDSEVVSLLSGTAGFDGPSIWLCAGGAASKIAAQADRKHFM